MTLHHRRDPRRSHRGKPIEILRYVYVPPIAVADQFPTERTIEGVTYDIQFNGCQETPDWPLASASTLAGCARVLA